MNFKFLSSFAIIFSSASAVWLHSAQESYNSSNLPIQHQTVTEPGGKPSSPIQKKISSIFLNKKKISIDSIVTDEIEDPKTNLIDNWDFEGTGLSSEDMAPFFVDHQPESIVIQDVTGNKIIYPKHKASGDAQTDKIFYISTEALIQKIAQERSEQSDSHAFTYNSENEDDFNSSGLLHLPSNAYGVESFSAGTRRDGSILVPIAENLRSALNGPDYSFDNFPASDDKKMKEHLATVLPLGNGGTLILNINNLGVIYGNVGFDFSVYQTTFRIADTDMFWQKFAYVGVSDSLNAENVKWFPCEPKSSTLKGCVGVVPTNEGGDHFNITELGVRQARYIWIKDIGTNFDLKSKWPTEGCALDALRIYHAYITNWFNH